MPSSIWLRVLAWAVGVGLVVGTAALGLKHWMGWNIDTWLLGVLAGAVIGGIAGRLVRDHKKSMHQR